MIKLYFAPLEGITTATYRNAHARMFEGCDGYYAPFITPSDIERISLKSMRDILPENNKEIPLNVQVLTAQSDSFFKFAKKAESLGYREFNINLGCPSQTVVKKGRGAGFLKDPEGIDRFLYDIFERGGVSVSVKTRTGFFSGQEMEQLMQVYNKYPLSLLIIHPRARTDFYKGEPDMKVFREAYDVSTNPVCYNGNIFSKWDYDRIVEEYPGLNSVMIGRGAIKNPAIFRHIKGGLPLNADELKTFSRELIKNYMEKLDSEYFTLNKLKEIWMYIMWNYPEERKLLKAIKKTSKLSDFERILDTIPKLER